MKEKPVTCVARVTRGVRIFLCLVLLLVLAHPDSEAKKRSRPDRSLSLPGASWQLEVDRSYFTVAEERQGIDGKSRMFRFEHRDRFLEFTVSMVPTIDSRNSGEHRQARWEKVQASEPEKQQGRLWEEGDTSLLEYVVENPRNGVLTKHVHVFLLNDGTIIEFHFVKTRFRKADQKQLDALLRSVRIVPRSPSGA